MNKSHTPPRTTVLKELQGHWDDLGHRDPLWAIHTSPSKKENQWDLDEFFHTGRYEITQALVKVSEFLPRFHSGRALDFGCGVGRLTQGLCLYFEECWGIDIAPSMIEAARKYNGHGDKCHYLVNDREDLSFFESGTFDFVYSNIVLQHIHPDYSRRYIAEFVRLLKPGGILVFQLPTELKKPGPPIIGADCAMPDEAFHAEIHPEVTEISAAPAEWLHVPLRVRNPTRYHWPSIGHTNEPYQVRAANHWRFGNGQVLKFDDERVRLPWDMGPYEEVEIDFTVSAPSTEGHYLLEIDLMQEKIGWFAAHGSKTATIPVSVRAAHEPKIDVIPMMEMHGIPAGEVVELLQSLGAGVFHLESNDWATGWDGFRYFVIKHERPSPKSK